MYIKKVQRFRVLGSKVQGSKVQGSGLKVKMVKGKKSHSVRK